VTALGLEENCPSGRLLYDMATSRKGDLQLMQNPHFFGWLSEMRSNHFLYVDHSRRNGTAIYRLACQLDLGIVAKRANSLYEDNTKLRHWIKIKNPAYSQKEGGADLFKRAG
jgi:ATP-dependent DNA ligase